MRTASANPLALASTLRREVPRARPEFRVSNIRTQADLVRRADRSASGCWRCWRSSSPLVALLLAGIGLYGVLDYSVLQRRREIGIRMAIGAQAGDIARGVTAELFAMVLVGAVAGLALGDDRRRDTSTALLYQVKARRIRHAVAFPSATISRGRAARRAAGRDPRRAHRPGADAALGIGG